MNSAEKIMRNTEINCGIHVVVARGYVCKSFNQNHLSSEVKLAERQSRRGCKRQKTCASIKKNKMQISALVFQIYNDDHLINYIKNKGQLVDFIEMTKLYTVTIRTKSLQPSFNHLKGCWF